MFTSIGILEFRNNYWIIISVDSDLCRYYMTCFNKSHVVTDIQLMKPKWGGHITIVRGEYEQYELNKKNDQVIKENDNKLIEFKYSHETYGNGNHYWLDIDCDKALNLREELGLDRNMLIPLHLTFGVKREI